VAKREVIGTQTNTFQYVWDGWNLVAVLDEDGALKEFYTRGVGIAGDIGTLVAVTHYTDGSPTATYYLHNNHRGDVIMAREDADTVAMLDYAPYGELRSRSGSYAPRFHFSSKEYDASSGFYHFPYRYYAPQWARWITRDPVYELSTDSLSIALLGRSLGRSSYRKDVMSWNVGRLPISDPPNYLDGLMPYVYVGNSPICKSDPSGLSASDGFVYDHPPGTSYCELFCMRACTICPFAWCTVTGSAGCSTCPDGWLIASGRFPWYIGGRLWSSCPGCLA
jgi:RHS repeat-associated protein